MYVTMQHIQRLPFFRIRNTLKMRKTTWLPLFREIVTVCVRNVKNTRTMCGKINVLNAEVVYIFTIMFYGLKPRAYYGSRYCN
jgi:hypothetical protein